jgi:hypothetical protein
MPDIKISEITIDPALMPRDGLDEDTVVEYVAAWLRGATFPPVSLVRVDKLLLLADGWHRVEAAARAGKPRVAAAITHGTRRDALVIGLKANSAHGLRPRPQDCRRMVELILGDKEFAALSTNKIADMCNLSWGTVDKIRRALGAKPEIVEYTTRHGNTATMRPRAPADDDPLAGPTAEPAGSPRGTMPDSPRLDAAGKPVPRRLADHWGDSMLAFEASRLRSLARQIDARGRTNPWLRVAAIVEALDSAATALSDAEPSIVHQACRGAGCEMCRHAGWMPAWAAEEEESR